MPDCDKSGGVFCPKIQLAPGMQDITAADGKTGTFLDKRSSPKTTRRVRCRRGDTPVGLRMHRA